MTLTHNDSDSAAPVGWYHVHWGEKPQRYDLVLLKMPAKRYAAHAGDRVTFSPQGIAVNGRLIANTAPEPGIPRVCPYGTYTVPQYMFLGLGTLNPDSWDGRYTCFLPESLIAGTETPLW